MRINLVAQKEMICYFVFDIQRGKRDQWKKHHRQTEHTLYTNVIRSQCKTMNQFLSLILLLFLSQSLYAQGYVETHLTLWGILLIPAVMSAFIAKTKKMIWLVIGVLISMFSIWFSSLGFSNYLTLAAFVLPFLLIPLSIASRWLKLDN